MLKRHLASAALVVLLISSVISPAYALNANDYKGSIQGRIVGHSNTPSDGTDDSFSQGEMIPLAGVKVSLNGPVNLETTTDEKGSYSFVNIPVGEYEVHTQSEFHVNQKLSSIMLDEGEILNLNAQNDDLTLGSTFYLFSGINDYEEVFFGEYCMNYMYDAFSYYNVLAKNTDRIIGEKFTKKEFFEYFQRIGPKMETTDTFVFYYYGKIYTDESDGEIYLSCEDSQFTEESPVFSTLISSSEISDLINANFVNSPNTFLLLEGAHTNEMAIKLLEEVEVPFGVLAAAFGGMWFEVANVDNGLMSHALRLSIDISLATLKARCDLDGDDCVTIEEVVWAVEDFVSLYTVFITQEVSFHTNEDFRSDAKFFKHMEYDFSNL